MRCGTRKQAAGSPLGLAFFVALPALLLATPFASASGFLVYEQGAAAAAQAGAFVARADDASALFYNPAGIAALPGRGAFYAGPTFVIPENAYSSASGTFQQSHGIYFPPHLYLAYKYGNNVTLGVGFFSQFGLAADQANDLSPVRFLSSRTRISTYEIESAVAIGDDSFAVALAADYVVGSVEFERARLLDIEGLPAPVEVDGKIEGDSTALGWNLGVRWRQGRSVFGLTYRSEKSLVFDDAKARFEQRTFVDDAAVAAIVRQLLPGGTVKTSIDLPASGAFGWGTTVRDTSFEFDVTWTQWSSFDTIPFDYRNETAALADEEADKDWSDVLSYRLGVDWRMLERTHLRLGASFEEDPVPERTLSPDMPGGTRWSGQLGLGFQINRAKIDLFYQYVLIGDRSSSNQEIQQPGRPGTYEQNTQIFGFSLGYNF